MKPLFKFAFLLWISIFSTIGKEQVEIITVVSDVGDVQ